MSHEKMREIIGMYRIRFEAMNGTKWEFPKSHKPAAPSHVYAHLYWMLDEIEKFLTEGRIDQANWCLGFIQGVFWINGVFTIEELTNHSKSPFA